MRKKLYYSFYGDKCICLLLALVFCSSIAFGQQIVTGKVFDGKGETLPGVSIKLKNTTTGSVTDVNGNFSIQVPDLNGTLVFAYIGYKSVEQSINSRTSINVTLEAESTALNEVVVVGFGTQKKVNLTGSVSTINSEQLTMRPV